MRVTIIGPNLPKPLQDMGEFHVHAAGCRDIATRYPACEMFDLETETRVDIAEAVHGDIIDEGGYTDAEDALRYGYHFAPCARQIPLK